jgi:hypothetical protein
VACASDISVTAGTVPYQGPAGTAANGTWQQHGDVSVDEYAKLKLAGAPVIYQATCTFLFNGFTSTNTAVTATSTVTLSASPTTLQAKESGVLSNGSSATDAWGNTLTAVSGGKLRSG